MPKATPNFSDAMQALDEAVSKLKTGQLPLEEALKTFEEGVNLIQICQKQLTEVKGKVEILSKSIGEDGEIETDDFDDED